MNRRHWAIALAVSVAVVALAFALVDGERRLPLLRSLSVGVVAGMTALVLGTAYALALARWKTPGSALLGWLGVAPLVVPPYLAAIGYLDAFGPAGRVPRLLGMDLPDRPSLIAESWIYTTGSCGFLLGCSLFPLVYLAARGALRRVPRTALEAARLARGAAGERRALLAVALPPALAAASFVFALASVEFAVPQLLRIKVLAEEVYLKMSAEADATGALGAAAPLLAVALVAVAAALALWRRPPVPGDESMSPRPAGKARGAALWIGCGLALAPGFLLPALAVAVRLFSDPRGRGGGATRAAEIMSDAMRDGAGDAGRSVLVGVLTASVGLLLALLVAWPLRRLGRLPRLGVAAALGALTICPAPIVAVAAILILNRPGLTALYDGLGSVVVTSLARFLPLAVGVAWLALARVPRQQEEASRLAGRPPLLGVLLPQAAPSLLLAWLILYVLTVTEFGATAVIEPPGESLLAVFLVNQAHYGQGAELSGLCTLLAGVVLLPWIPVGALGALGRRRWGR